MKTLLNTIASALFALISPAAGAQTTVPDTIAHITDATRLIITENPEEMKVMITRVENGDTITDDISRSLDNTVVRQRTWNSPLHTFSSGTNSKWDFCLGGPGIGWVNASGQPAGLGIEMGKSLEISWLNMVSVKYSMPHSVLSIGFGFDWRNYRISTSSHGFIPTENGGVGIGPYPEGTTSHGSRLKIFSMGVPVLWTQLLPLKWLDGRPLAITAGAVFNYNSHGSLQTKWTEADGTEATLKTNHIGHRRFSIDFIGLVKIGWGLNAYVRYSPNTVLRGAGQPRFKPFSTGLIFMY